MILYVVLNELNVVHFTIRQAPDTAPELSGPFAESGYSA